MLMLVSPAKTLDYETELPIQDFTQPELLGDAQELIDQLKKLTPVDVAKLMKLSDKPVSYTHLTLPTIRSV